MPHAQHGAVLGSQRGAAREGALTQDVSRLAGPAVLEGAGRAGCGLHEQAEMLPVHPVGCRFQQAQQVRAEQQVLRPGLRLVDGQLGRAGGKELDRDIPDPG